jgi:hypothetical protein
MSDKPKQWIAVMAVILLAAVLSSSARAQTDRQSLGPRVSISATDDRETLPDIAYNSVRNEYLVVWNYSPSGTSGEDIYAARISSQGEVLLSFAVAFGINAQTDPVVAFDPDQDRYLVVWEYDKNGDGSDIDLMGRFIPGYGPDPAQTEFAINDDPLDQQDPDVVYNTHPAWAEFMVVLNDRQPGPYWAITGVRASTLPDGSPVTTQITVADHGPDDRWSPAVAYNLSRNEYLVTYNHQETATTGIYATRLEANGSALDDGDGDPADGGEFAVAAGSDHEVDSEVLACPGHNQYLALWHISQSGHFDIFGSFVNGTGTPQPSFQVTNIPTNERLPRLACQADGSHMMAVWEQQYSNTLGPYGIWGRLIYPDGRMGPQTTIEGGITDAERWWPAVAGGHSEYFVVWSHQRYNSAILDIYGRAFSAFANFLPLITR